MIVTDVERFDGDLTEAYDSLGEARVRLYQATAAYDFMKWCQKASFAKDLLSGKISGKNELERDSSHRSLRKRIYRWLETSMRASDKARCDFDVATYKVELVRARLRLAEVLSHGLESDGFPP